MSSEDKPKRKRKQWHACDMCRTRKIRCNSSSAEQTCSNCSEAKLNCTYNYVSSKPAIGANVKNKEKFQGNVVDGDPHNFDFFDERPGLHSDSPRLVKRSTSSSDDDSLLISKLDGIQLDHKVYANLYSPHNILFREGGNELLNTSSQKAKARVRQMGLMSIDKSRSATTEYKLSGLLHLMPSFPSRIVRDSVIDIYWNSVFRMTQMMEYEQFYDQYNATFGYLDESDIHSLDAVPPPPPPPSTPFSIDHNVFLMICHVLIAAGCQYSDHPLIRKDGNNDIACKALQDKANLALTIFWNEPRVEVIQCFVIMSLIAFGEQSRNHMWLYTGVAARLALGLGMHREFTYKPLTERERKIRRRTWWVIYISDKMVGIGTSKPSMINDLDVDTALPTEADYQSAAKYPTPEKFFDASMFGKYSRHCIHITQVYDMLVHKLFSPMALRRPVPQDFINALDLKLTKWYMGLDKVFRWGTDECNKLPIWAEVLMAQMNLSFHLAIIMLNRRTVEDNLQNYEQLCKLSSFHSSNTSANTILDIVTEMRSKKILKYSTPFPIYVTYVAIVQCILIYRRSDNIDERSNARNAIYRGVEALWEMRETWINAGYLAIQMESLMSKWGESETTSPPAMTDSSESPLNIDKMEENWCPTPWVTTPTDSETMMKNVPTPPIQLPNLNTSLIASRIFHVKPPEPEPAWQDTTGILLNKVISPPNLPDDIRMTVPSVLTHPNGMVQEPRTMPTANNNSISQQPPIPIKFDTSLNWQWLDTTPNVSAPPPFPISETIQMFNNPSLGNMNYPISGPYFTRYDNYVDPAFYKQISEPIPPSLPPNTNLHIW